MSVSNWRERFQAEIFEAEKARNSENEGMARVCARRAAGIVIQEYFTRTGRLAPGRSAYDYLRRLAALPDTEADVRQVVEHFLVRITPEHNLPIEADLLAEARWLAEKLID